MADRNVSIAVETDESAVSRAKKELQRIEKAQMDLRDSFRQGDRDVKSFTDELSNLEREAKSLNRALDALEEPRRLKVQLGEFDRVSRDVSAAGDAQSNLGAIQALTGGQLGGGIGAAGEAIALVEELPRLKAALSALPDTAAAAAQALGKGGLALGALAAAAALAVSSILEQQARAAARLGTAIDEYEAFNRAIAAGEQTTAKTRQELEELNRARQFEEDNVKRLQAQIAAEEQRIRDTALDPVSGEILVKTNEGLNELRKQLTEAEKAEQANKTAIDLRTDALEEGTLATADAIEAERQLANERLTEAANAGDLARLEAEALDLTYEQIEARQRSIELQRIELEAELAALEAAENRSDKENERIQQLQDELDQLEERNQIYENAKVNAERSNEAEQELATTRATSMQATEDTTKAEQAKAQAERQAAEAAREQQRAAEEAAKAQQRYAEAILDARTDYQNAIEDIGTDLSDGLIDARTDLQDSIADLERRFNADEIKASRAHRRSLAQLNKQADEAEEGAIRQRNFLALADAREDAKDAIGRAKEAFEEEGAERLIEAQQQKDDIVTVAQRQTRDLKIEADRRQRDAEIQRDRAILAARQQLSIQEQGQNASLNLMQNYWQAFIQQQQQALTAASPSASASPNNSGSGDPLTALTAPTRFGANL